MSRQATSRTVAFHRLNQGLRPASGVRNSNFSGDAFFQNALRTFECDSKGLKLQVGNFQMDAFFQAVGRTGLTMRHT